MVNHYSVTQSVPYVGIELLKTAELVKRDIPNTEFSNLNYSSQIIISNCCELNQEYILYFQDIYFSIFACSLMHSLKVSDHSGCIWNAARDTEWCCCTMMLTASSPCCIQRDFPICAAAGGIESPGGGVFKRCRWHTMVEKLQVVKFSDGSQKLQVACHGGEIVESIESASGVSYHRRWRSFRWNLAGDLSVISWSSVR